jgi:hypothetical protein
MSKPVWAENFVFMVFQVYIYMSGSLFGYKFLFFQYYMFEGDVGQKIWLRAEFNFNNRKYWNSVFLGKMNSGGIIRASGGNTWDSGENDRNDFFENSKIIFWLKWVRVEFGALDGILRFGQISWLNWLYKDLGIYLYFIWNIFEIEIFILYIKLLYIFQYIIFNI